MFILITNMTKSCKMLCLMTRRNRLNIISYRSFLILQQSTYTFCLTIVTDHRLQYHKNNWRPSQHFKLRWSFQVANQLHLIFHTYSGLAIKKKRKETVVMCQRWKCRDAHLSHQFVRQTITSVVKEPEVVKMHYLVLLVIIVFHTIVITCETTVLFICFYKSR